MNTPTNSTFFGGKWIAHNLGNKRVPTKASNMFNWYSQNLSLDQLWIQVAMLDKNQENVTLKIFSAQQLLSSVSWEFIFAFRFTKLDQQISQ